MIRSVRSRALIGSLAAAALLLSACSNSDEPEASEQSTASTSTENAGTESAAPEQSAATSSTPDVESSPSSSAVPTTLMGEEVAELDEATRNWFDTLCTGMTPVTELKGLALAFNEAGTIDEEAVTELSGSLLEVGESMTATSAELGERDAPPFSGGEDLAPRLVSALGAMGDAYEKASMSAAMNDPSTFTALATDLDTVFVEYEIDGIAFAPGLNAALGSIDSCKEIGFAG